MLGMGENFTGSQQITLRKVSVVLVGRLRSLMMLIPIVAMLIAACSGSTRSTLVVRNGMLIDGSGGAPIENGLLVIEDGIIIAVGSAAEVEIPDGAREIDAGGGTILPGMIDAHTHVLGSLNIDDGAVGDIGRIQYLEKTVQAGVTTIRDVGSRYQTEDEIIEVRAALAALGNNAPRVVLTGPLLLAPENWGLEFDAVEVGSEAEAQEVAAELISAGVDQLKLFMDVGEPPTPTLTEEQVMAIMQVANQSGIWVTAHAIQDEAEIALRAGVDELAHWPSGVRVGGKHWDVPESLLRSLAEQNVPIVSTFNLTPPEEAEVRFFLDSGGKLAFGTDSPGTGPLSQPTREFRLMRTFGMTPMECILAATANSATVIGMEEEVGRLQPGMQADVIVVDGNPLEDIMAMGGISVVIRGGEVVYEESANE